MEMDDTLPLASNTTGSNQKIMLSIFEDHEYAFIIQNDFFQTDNIKVIHFST